METTSAQEPTEEGTRRPRGAAPGGRRWWRRWWRRPWVGPLAVVCLAFLAFSLPPYLTFDPARTRLPLREGFDAHHPLLVLHVLTGSVALLTCCLQVWPWLRRRHPAVHRVVGRVYLLGGVLPSGLAILVVTPHSVQGVVGRVGNTTLAVVWLLVSLAGFRAARRRQFARHRRWMVISFALTTSIVANRVWLLLCLALLAGRTPTTFGGDRQAMVQAAVESSIWLSWVVNLLLALWWLERDREPGRRAGAGQRRAAAERPSGRLPG